jgi:glucokinase
MILVGDIGGTKSHLALFEGETIVREEKFSSREASSLEAIARQFLGGSGVTAICFAVAGPVVRGVCKATNLPWVLKERSLSKELGAPTTLCNDLEAMAAGASMLTPEKGLLVLREGKVRRGNRAVIAAGTGLGVAGLIRRRGKEVPLASEGGHADFAPQDERGAKLFHDLREKYGHVSYERVLSGPGLEHLYWFLVEKENFPDELKTKEEIPRRIVNMATERRGTTCLEVVRWFAALYGAAAGNVALHFLATGGVFFGGGIAPVIAPFLDSGEFFRAFGAKGRFQAMLDEIPLYVITDPHVVLRGAKGIL